MNTFPTLFDWIERLDFLRGMPAAYLLLLAGVVVVAVWEWRVALVALTLQYLLGGLLFVEVLEPRLAIVKVLVGLFIALMLYLTARQADEGTSPGQHPASEPPGVAFSGQRLHPFLTPRNLFFRLLLAVLSLLVIFVLVGRPGNQLPAVPPALNLAVFGLVALGLLGIILSTAPLPAGQGLLMVMLGFEFFYNSLEQSVTMLVVVAAVNLAIALAIAYLTQARAFALSAAAPPAE